ncbi:TetR/AcrR family transcriptional regulator [Sphingomonas koreensis]|nr:TetR/AcrR family transcriptional regulator [Sphingomonas koreensis]
MMLVRLGWSITLMTFDIYIDDDHHLTCQVEKEMCVARVNQQEKDRSRERIVRGAARLFRERGVEGASVGEVMKEAGLTHGGFYRHFATKDAMLDGALEAAFREIVAPLEAGLAEEDGAVVGQKFRQFYLSDDHLYNAGLGCPAAALAGEIARAPQTTKQTFAAGFRKMLALMTRTKTGDLARREVKAARELAMMVGAMTIARASDPETAQLVLLACRDQS